MNRGEEVKMEGTVDQKKYEYTEAFLTRQGKEVLICLYSNPEICSSMLAEKMKISKNSMSNALERLRGSEYALVVSEQYGRQKRYSLTAWGREYTETCLLMNRVPEGKRLASEKTPRFEFKDESCSQKDKANECMNDLERICSEWEMEFFHYLVDENAVHDENKCLLMKELLDELSNLYSKDGKTEFNEVIERMKSTVLKKNIIERIRYRSGLVPLWDWAEESWLSAYRYVDELFEGCRMVTMERFLQKYKKYDITEWVFKQITISLCHLVDEALTNQWGKDDVFRYLTERYPACEEKLAFYIGEKYRELRNEYMK